jgi:glycosyltransferase involved in cell wall biosynthesis
MQSRTLNAALMFERHGYEVDVFLYRVQEVYANVEQTNSVHIYRFLDYDSSSTETVNFMKVANIKNIIIRYPLLYCMMRYIKQSLNNAAEIIKRLTAGSDEFYLLPRWLFDSTYDIVKKYHYKCFIGIEKMGLIWAGIMASQMNVPFMYYSSELYITDHPLYSGVKFKYLRKVEQKYHQKSIATIIQDPERAEVLLRANNVSNTELLYVPTSILGEPVKVKTDYLRKRFSIPADKTIILYFGAIRSGKAGRFCLEIAQASQNFPEDWIIVMHGPGPVSDPSYIEAIRMFDANKRIIISLDLVPQDQIWQLIASADIGLVFYPSSPLNNYLTGLASEKMALYLQAGLPVVAFNYPSFTRIIDHYRCGICISGFHELKSAIETILSRYDEFRQNAWQCYLENYEFSRQFQKVIERISQL